MSKEDYIAVGRGKPFQEKRGDITITRTTAWSAPGCHNGCGVLLHTDKDGNLIKVEGDPDAPFNEGRLCLRCLAMPQTLNDPKRQLYPMKRAREDRGKDKWERISWEEAIDTIVENFLSIKKKYGAETVMFNQGTGRDITYYQTYMASAFGSPNVLGWQPGESCYLPRITGMAATVGGFFLADYSQQFVDRYNNPEWVVPKTFVVWGANFLVSNSDGNMGYWTLELMKRGSKLIVIDPKITWLSSRAEVVLRVRPGTDGALAMGMVNYLIENDLYDHDFVDKWCSGFEQLAERAKEYPLDKVAEICCLSEADIIRSVRMIAESKPTSMQWGLPMDCNNDEAVPAAFAVQCVFILTGNIDNPGGCIMPVDIQTYEGPGFSTELLTEEMRSKKLGIDKYKLYKYGSTAGSPDATLETLETGLPYKMHGAWIQSCNALTCCGADPDRLYNAMKDLDFIVMVDPYMTPTAMALADIHLPVCFFPERNGIALTTGAQRAAVMTKVCEPKGESRSDPWICYNVGKRLSPEAWPWENVEDMFSQFIEVTGYTFDELTNNAPIYPPFEYYKYEKGMLRPDGQPGFNTATGQIELYSTMFEFMDLDPLPYYEEPVPSPISTPDLFEKYPLILITGTRRFSFFHSEHRTVPLLRNVCQDPEIELHPEDAAAFGVAQGEWVWVRNYLGRAKRRVIVTKETLKGTVTTDHAWWYPEGDPDDWYGVREVNINNLLPFTCGKSGFGTNFKANLCTITKVEG